MYAMTSTRLDICHVVRLASRYQSNLGKTHWQAVKRIFRYLQSTKNMGLCFGLGDLEIAGYTNAYFAGDTNDKKSTSGYVFMFGGTVVCCLSKKYNCVSKSTMEAMYVSCNTKVINAVWIKWFVGSLNLGIPSKPINVFCDNKFVVSLIKIQTHSSKDKPINLNYHYIQDMVEKSEIKVESIPLIETMADPMIKGLSLDKFREHVVPMGLRNT
jgi:hypothetical protein